VDRWVDVSRRMSLPTISVELISRCGAVIEITLLLGFTSHVIIMS